MKPRRLLLITFLLMGCETTENDWNIIDEIDWSEVSTTVDEEDVYLPVVENRTNLYRVGPDTMGSVEYWDGETWVLADEYLIIPEGWYVGPETCD